jgi:hypothetical protein
MDEDPFGAGLLAPEDLTITTQRAATTSQGTSASMHARNIPLSDLAPIDFGNTLRNRDMQDRICKAALAKAADNRTRAQAGAAATPPWQLEGQRPLGQVTPRPNNGFPTHQAVDAISLYRGAIRLSTESNFTTAQRV